MEPDPERAAHALPPDLLRKRAAGAPPPEPEVGDFRQGSPLSQWALSRYLVGRAVAESAGIALLLLALGVLGLAAVAEWALHSTLLAVLLVIVAVLVLLLRRVLLAVVRRLTAVDRPVEDRLTALVADTRSDVLRELRRVGLPGRTLTLPLLALRFLRRRRRAQTVTRLRAFEIERVVPKARLDETFLLLRGAFTDGFGGGIRPDGPAAGR